MKKIAHAFAKASFIICIANCALSFTISFFILISWFFKMNDSYLTGLVYLYSSISSGLGIYFSRALLTRIEKATSKSQITAMAVCTIIFGFPPAGILALCIPNEQFSSENPIEVPCEDVKKVEKEEAQKEKKPKKEQTPKNVKVEDTKTHGNNRGAI